MNALMKNKLIRVLIGTTACLILAGLATGAALWTLRAQVSGTVVVERGLKEPVEILRDSAGVPTLFAGSAEDAYFALGYVHAQDRFWQMEMMRRFGAGRLAEVLGADAVRTDRWMRALGLWHLAAKDYTGLSAPVRDALDSYACGVNSWLAERGRLPTLEMALFRYRPDPWTPADSLVWSKIMATRLGGNWRAEVLRARLARQLPPERIGELWPAYPSDAPVSVTSSLAGIELPDLAELSPEAPGLPRGASNVWAVAPAQTSTGAPILANDPHLGFNVPILWYLARIEAPDLQVTGATVPGVPFTILGHNQRIAWGVTATQSDSADLFVERLESGDFDRYLTAKGSRPFYRRRELIKVKGAADVELDVRLSGHGPIISDLRGDVAAMSASGHVVSLAATYLEPGDRTAEAFYHLNRAGSWQTFTEAARDIHAPQLNLAYADKAGNIGFAAPGLVPLRRGGSGTVPSPGWTGETDWEGFIPFDALPRSFNPASGRIVNANNRIVGDAYPHFISHDWAMRYRAERIEDLLEQGGRHSLDGAAKIQRDYVSLMARDLLPLMLEAEPETTRQAEALVLLRTWDGAMSKQRPEPLIFSTWLRELNDAVYGDELGDFTDAYLSLRPRFIRSVLTRRNDWCDDIATPAREACGSRLLMSLDRALNHLTGKYGQDMAAWQWSSAHIARFRHPVLSHVPFLRRFSNLAVATDGGNYTVNRGASRISNATDPFGHIHGPGFRAIYDLSDLAKSRFMIATGQSGNPFSPHYSDLMAAWAAGRYRTIGASKAEIAEGFENRLTLRPHDWP